MSELDLDAEYRVDFSVLRRLPDEDDFTEIGFGSTVAEESLDQAAHMVLGALQNDEWDYT